MTIARAFPDQPFPDRGMGLAPSAPFCAIALRLIKSVPSEADRRERRRVLTRPYYRLLSAEGIRLVGLEEP
jgi:hypothetical protein